MTEEITPDPPHARFSAVLDNFARTITDNAVPLGTLMAAFGRESVAAVLIVFALPMVLPIPLLGLSLPFGIVLLLVSTQLLFHARKLWLPARVMKRPVPRATLLSVVERALPWLRRVEKIARPRLMVLTRDWALYPIGIMCVLMSVIIALPIPLGHLWPGATIILMALGLIERDGVAILVGMLAGVVAIVVVSVASASVAVILHRWLAPILSP